MSGKSRLFYNGIPLIRYCRDNCINFSTVKSSICKKRKDPKFSDYTEQEIVNMVINAYSKQIKYVYDDNSLSQYCKKNNINYRTIIAKIHSLKKNYPDLDNDELINIALGKRGVVKDNINKNRNYKDRYGKYKYFYCGIPLKEYCVQNNIDYDIIKHRINYLQKSNPSLDDMDLEKIIRETIEKIQIKNHIKYINEIFDFLKNEELDDIQKLVHICKFLKIDYNCVIALKNMNFSYNQAINMIWYFSDNINSQDYKTITYKRIKELLSFIKQVEQSNEKNINDFELYDLIGIYKSQLYDSRNKILLLENGYIYKTIQLLCSSYEIKINNNNYEDFYSEIKLNILNAIEKSNLNTVGQIIKYIDLNVKGYFRLYLKKYKKDFNELILDDAKFIRDKDTKDSKKRIDFIADKTNQDTELKESLFSSNMKKVLSALPKEDIQFITLKFQENYTDYELSEYFKVTIDDINQRETNILSTLKKNPNVKVLKK